MQPWNDQCQYEGRLSNHERGELGGERDREARFPVYIALFHDLCMSKHGSHCSRSGIQTSSSAMRRFLKDCVRGTPSRHVITQNDQKGYRERLGHTDRPQRLREDAWNATAA